MTTALVPAASTPGQVAEPGPRRPEPAPTRPIRTPGSTAGGARSGAVTPGAPLAARRARVRTARAVAPRAAPVRRTHLAPVPDCEPPYDDERPGYGPVSSAAARWSWSRSVGAPVADWTVPGWCNDADMGVSRTRRSALPEPRETAGVLARAFIEALAGLRPLGQLSNHCSPEVFAGLKMRLRPGGSPPKLMSVRASEPTDGVAEASAVFRRGQRAAAIAFRMQGIDGRWRVTDLQIG